MLFFLRIEQLVEFFQSVTEVALQFVKGTIRRIVTANQNIVNTGTGASREKFADGGAHAASGPVADMSLADFLGCRVAGAAGALGCR